ncbi:MAG: hypothetical protein JO250_17860 [Armatimonadetes bacterium]|nr:hypothetical protein [Armatimonadota bacterium]
MKHRTSRFSLAALLALGGVAGLLIGTGLPRTQAQSSGTAISADPILAARLQRLESRVNALESDVRELKTRPVSIITPGNGLGGNGFGPGLQQPTQPQQPQWKIVPVTK